MPWNHKLDQGMVTTAQAASALKLIELVLFYVTDLETGGWHNFISEWYPVMKFAMFNLDTAPNFVCVLQNLLLYARGPWVILLLSCITFFLKKGL